MASFHQSQFQFFHLSLVLYEEPKVIPNFPFLISHFGSTSHVLPTPKIYLRSHLRKYGRRSGSLSFFAVKKLKHEDVRQNFGSAITSNYLE